MKKPLLALLGAGLLHLPSMASAYVVGPTTPGKWGDPTMGTGATITWSLMAAGVSCDIPGVEPSGCTTSALSTFMPAGYLTEIQKAFDAWSAVANITFVQVPDDGAPFNSPTSSGDIRLGGHVFDGAFGTLAHCYYPPVNGDTAAGDCHFDTAENWDLSLAGPGISIFQVTAHELGHALGLDHTAVPNSLMNPIYSEAFSGPQADDIAGIQFIYGAAVVPEPTSLSLLALGLLGLGGRRLGARAA